MTSRQIPQARGCLLGLAIGDALGGPTEGMTPDAISRRWGRVTDFLSPEQSGSDDTEYALFNARLIAAHGPRLTAVLIAEAWKRDIISASNAYKGAGFSEMLAIRNLKAGLGPPESGQHLHSWSDGLAMRVAPFGIVAAGRPQLAIRLAAMDGSVTHAGEGVFAGQAVGAAIAIACAGGTLEDVTEGARQAVPKDSWTLRAIDNGVSIGSSHTSVWDALGPLFVRIVQRSYYWSDLAPEAVGLAFGVLVAARGDFRETLLGSVNVGRDTDTIAAIAGAIAGALNGVEAIPAEWAKRIGAARGSCLQVVQGMTIIETADMLVDASGTWT